MKTSFQRSLGLTALALATTLAFGCDDHFSTQDAYATCQDLIDSNPGANSPGSFDDCVACYESCGGECTQGGTSPETYLCPDEVGAGGGGEGGSGGGDS